MNAVRGTWTQGRIVLDEPTAWPEGTRVEIGPLVGEGLGLRDEDWPTDPEGIAALLARLNEVEPLEISPEEQAELDAWRKTVKEHTIARGAERIEGLFP